MSQSTTQFLFRSGIIGGGAGLLLGLAVCLFSAPPMGIAQTDWNDFWNVAEEVQLAEPTTANTELAAIGIAPTDLD